MEFAVDKVAVLNAFDRVLLFFPVNIFPPFLPMLLYHLREEQQAR
jgi:hypothetical protein